MSRSVRAAPKLTAYLFLSGLGMLAGAFLARPELAEIGLVFLIPILGSVLFAEPPAVSLDARLLRTRIVEDEETELEVELRTTTAVPWLQLLVALPSDLEPNSSAALATLRLSAGSARTLSFRLRAPRWGVFHIGRFELAARDALGFFTFEDTIHRELTLRAYPREERLARLIGPAETQLHVGSLVSSRAGEGLELAEVRPFVTGDRLRRINWRVSSRSTTLHVNETLPERDADIVLFLDTFTGPERGREDTLLRAVRAAAALARSYLKVRDRVGLLSFGGVLSWLLRSSGTTQLYRILDALIDSEAIVSYAWKDAETIPPRTLPPKALLIALTPLLDPRTIATLLGLRARGFDLAVVEVSPFVEEGREDAARLAQRLWLLKREVVRHELRSVGVPVVTWDRGGDLAAVLEEVREYRRFVRRVRG